MTQPLLDRTDSARRPFNAWFWIALAALVVLVGVTVLVHALGMGGFAVPAWFYTFFAG